MRRKSSYRLSFHNHGNNGEYACNLVKVKHEILNKNSACDLWYGKESTIM